MAPETLSPPSWQMPLKISILFFEPFPYEIQYYFLHPLLLGKIEVAAVRGEEIPAGWAVNGEGRDTTDPK